MNALDLVLAVAALIFAVSGYRQGFVLGVLGFGGFVAGGIGGLMLVPPLVSRLEDGHAQTALAIGLVLLCATLGQMALGWIGGSLRRRLSWRPVRVLDSALGAALSVVALLLVAWSLGSALRTGPLPSVSRQISGSDVIRSVDDAMPRGAQGIFRSIRSVLGENDFPPVFGGLEPERIRPVEPPAAGITATPAIRRAGTSVVKIRADAESCDRMLDGSGFVFAPEYVLTNAHVVAGASGATVQPGGTGRRYDARVVLFDPSHDLAVLRVPDLSARPLLFDGKGGSRGDQAVVAGFPGGGVYRLAPARIRDTIEARGPDIYHENQVEREVFSLLARVEAGNSGGPLLDLDGEVLGVLFAKSLDDANTGYALTMKEIRPVVQKGNGLTRTVGTGSCT